MASPDTTNGGAATKSDVANLKRAARRHDEEHDRAYQAGLTGDEASAPGLDAPQSVLDAYDQGVKERASQPTKSSSPGTPPSRARKSSPGRTAQGRRGPAGAGRTVTKISANGSGFLLGAIGYALVSSYINYGWAGVTSWLSAKFINRPTIGLSANIANGAYAGAHAAAPGPWTPTIRSSNPNSLGPQ